MNEPRKQGRQKKHLEHEHHFRPSEDNLDDIFGSTEPDSVDSPQEFVDAIETHAVIIEESPAEEKIHQLVEDAIASHEVEDGWNILDTDILSKMPPRNGMPVLVSATPNGEVVKAMWRKTRAFANPTKLWKETGKWVDFFSGMDIAFEAKYWKGCV